MVMYANSCVPELTGAFQLPSVESMPTRTRRPFMTNEPLSADGLVMAQAAAPHGARDGPGQKKPAGLDRECLPELGAFEALQENRDRAKQFIVERHPFHRGLNSGRHDIDGKHLAAEEILER